MLDSWAGVEGQEPRLRVRGDLVKMTASLRQALGDPVRGCARLVAYQLDTPAGLHDAAAWH